MNLNASEWKEFTLGDLFEIKKGKRLTSAEQEEGNNNYIGAIDSNNGVANHIAQSPIHKGNTISLSYNGSVGEAFYQTEPYWATDDVNALYSYYEGFNKEIGLFFCTILRQEKYRFSYGRKWTLDNMKTTIIKLPVKHNNNGSIFIDETKAYSGNGYVPDWNFMENYIKSLHHNPITTNNRNNEIYLNTENWDEFVLNKLFSIEVANSADFGNLQKGSTKFIGRTETNNGVQGYVEALNITNGNCITISMVGTNVALYQENEFQASQNIAVLRRPNINVHIALFICSLINYEMKLKYSYGRTVGKTNIESMILKLPVNSKGEPDWIYMENYIKSLPYGDRI